MSEKRGKRKREGTTGAGTEKQRNSKRGKKEQITQDDAVVGIENDVDVVIEVNDEKEQRERIENVLGKREQQSEGEREREGVVLMKRKEEEEKKKRFECGICLELMSWEKEPRLLPCCGLSFCFPCLTKLFLLQNPSPSSSPSSSSPSSSSSSSPPTSSSSSSSSSSSPSCSSSSSSSLKEVKCPVCREMNECESVETLSINYLIPETIDVLLSSNLISFSNQSTSGFYFFFSFLFFLFGGELTNIKIEEEVVPRCVNFEMCGEQTRMYCSDCKVFICDSCDSSHSSSIFSRNHNRSQQRTLICDDGGGDDGLVGLENLKKRECSKHPSKTISGYCFQCSSFVCGCCILETHVKHIEKVKSIEESILEKRDEVVKIGDRLERRLIVIEEKRKKIEKEMIELEEKLEKKRIEKKEIELEKEDLRIRKDSIIRLSNTPTEISLFDDQLFSTLLQTATDIVFEGGVVGLLKPKKGVICCDGGGDWFCVVSSFPLKSEPLGVSVNSDGNLFICECDGLKVRDKEGNEMIESTIQKTIDSLQLEPVDVSIGLNDQIVVLDCSLDFYGVVILNEEGELIKSFGSFGSEDGQFSDPNGVDVDEEGRIIVADSYNHRIQVFDKDGSFLRSFGSKGSSEGQFNNPASLVVDGDGNIVICDCSNHRIQVMDIEGNFIRCFGTEGSGDSQLSYPQGVDVDGEGRIVVCDTGNGRVSVFEKDGTFLFSFGEDYMSEPCGIVVDSFGSIIVSEEDGNTIEFWNN